MYIDRLNERIARRNEAADTHTMSTPWRVEYEMAKRRGEVQRVYGVN